ncbi:unnamed protein product [Rhodiola kirilowii]
MLVSALFTSVGINSSLCLIFFMLYSVLRKQPSNYDVYIPRLLSNGKHKHVSDFGLTRCLPSPSWVNKAWELSEDELLSLSGLDAVVFIRMLIFSLKVFSVTGAIGIFLLLPVNCLGTQLEHFDFSNLTNNSLDLFSISNVNNGSKSLWVHFVAVYIVTFWVCYLLYHEYMYISAKRIDYFHSSRPQPHHFTVLIHSIPVFDGRSISTSIERFFRNYYPSTYFSHVVIRRTNRLRKLVTNAKSLYKRTMEIRRKTKSSDNPQGGCFGFIRRRVDNVVHIEKKLKDIAEYVKMEQSGIFSTGEVTRAAFVSFNSRHAAASAYHMRLAVNPTHWITERAPEPHDVYWPFFSSSFIRRWICRLAVIVGFTLFTLIFLIPVVVVQGLTNLNQLEDWFPFLTIIFSIPYVTSVITGYLPNVILQLFLKFVPHVMKFLTSIEGYISHSEIVNSACNKVIWFTIWNVFFATVFSGSALYQISIILDPSNILSRLAVAVPAQASFFIAYVVTSGWTGTASDLLRVIPLIISLARRSLLGTTEDRTPDDEQLEVPTIQYHKEFPQVLFFGLLGITYFFLAPLILPFLLIYFCFAYIIFRNQFINVYGHDYETGGKFWPVVHNTMIFSLLLMHAIAVGTFTLKKLSGASSMLFPLPIFTLIFNEYCRKRFLPTFQAYSAETLIKKDRQDQNDPTMSEFLNKLETAYQDPALMPMPFPTDPESLTSFLQSMRI